MLCSTCAYRPSVYVAASRSDRSPLADLSLPIWRFTNGSFYESGLELRECGNGTADSAAADVRITGAATLQGDSSSRAVVPRVCVLSAGKL
jgi:hypothetical protein